MSNEEQLVSNSTNKTNIINEDESMNEKDGLNEWINDPRYEYNNTDENMARLNNTSLNGFGAPQIADSLIELKCMTDCQTREHIYELVNIGEKESDYVEMKPSKPKRKNDKKAVTLLSTKDDQIKALSQQVKQLTQYIDFCNRQMKEMQKTINTRDRAITILQQSQSHAVPAIDTTKKRYQADPAVSTLLQIAAQNGQKRPDIGRAINTGTDDTPKWSSYIVYQDYRADGVLHPRKQEAETEAAAKILYWIRSNYFTSLNHKAQRTYIKWFNIDRPIFEDKHPDMLWIGDFKLKNKDHYIKDLCKDGDVERNPGPVYFNSSAISSTLTPYTINLLNLYTVGDTAKTDIDIDFAISDPTEGHYGTVSIAGVGFGTPFTGSITAIANSTCNLKTSFVSVPTSVTPQITFSWTAGSPSAVGNLNIVAATSYTNTTPLAVGIDDQPISATISGQPIDVTITGGAGDVVTIDPDSLPLWVSEYKPGSSVLFTKDSGAKDLTKDGDVEKNPGPNQLVDNSSDNFYGIEGADKTSGIKPYTPPHSGSDDLIEIMNKVMSGEMEPISEYHCQCILKGIPYKVEDDVEPMPTTQQYYDHVQAKCKLNGPVGEYFSIMAIILDIPVTENKYILLTQENSFEKEPDSEVIPLRKPPPKPKTRNELTESRPKTPPPQSKKEKPMTAEEKEKQYNAVISRIVNKLKNNMPSLIGWMKTLMTTKWKRTVLTELFGKDWEIKENMHQYEWIAYCDLNNVDDEERDYVLAAFDKDFEKYKFIDRFSAMNAKAKLHNKLVHAYNGNPFSKTFTETMQAPEWHELFDDENTLLKYQLGTELQSVLTNVDGSVNPNSSSIFDQDRLRGDVVDITNTTIQNAIMPIPCTTLIPREVRPAVAGININSTNRLPRMIANVSDYYTYPIEITALGNDLVTAVTTNKTSAWRGDNTTTAGYLNYDLVTLLQATVVKGLSLEQMLIKLDLMHSIAAQRVTTNSLPKALYSTIDSRTVATTTAPVLGINNSPVFGEDCGGATAVFPYQGGTGSLNFHLSSQTVPASERDLMWFFPSMLFNSSYIPNEAIALFILSVAEWPFGIFTVTKETTDTAGGNVDNTVYVPSQTLFRIPGDRNLHIVLPRNNPARNPTDQAGANNLCQIQPQCGPTASTGFAANAPLNVQYVGAPMQNYNLTEFLYTWATTFDQTTIRQYVANLGYIYGVFDTMMAVHEMNIVNCELFPPMIVSATSATAVLPVNSAAGFILSCGVHGLRALTTANWPQPTITNSHYRIQQTNNMAWNKVSTGLCVAANIKAEGAGYPPDYLGEPRNALWESLVALTMAGAAQTFFTSVGFTQSAWSNGYNNTIYRTFSDFVKGLYCTLAPDGNITPKATSLMINNIFKHMYQRMLVEVKNIGRSVETRPITCFDRFLPFSNFAVSYNAAGTTAYNGLVPCVIPDTWINLMSITEPKNMTSFSTPNQIDSVKGFGHKDGLIMHKNTNAAITTSYLDQPNMIANYGLDTLPDVSSKTRWNDRLWYTTAGRQIADYAGVAIAGLNFPPDGSYPRTQIVALNAGEVYPPDYVSANTTSLPVVTINGVRVYVYLPQAAATIPTNACQHVAQLTRPAWLLDGISPTNALLFMGRESMLNKLFNKLGNFRKEALVPDTGPISDTVLSQVIDPKSVPDSSIVSNITPEMTSSKEMATAS